MTAVFETCTDTMEDMSSVVWWQEGMKNKKGYLEGVGQGLTFWNVSNISEIHRHG